jgi:release factor glutamine methyltransferase
MYQSPLDGSFGRAEASGAATWGALLRWGTAELLAAEAGADIATDAGTGQAAREAALLLATALGVTRAALLAFPEREVPAAARACYGAWVARRRRGEPIAYLLGQREFWSLALEVTPQVLVPRPETELLVERALQLRGPAAATALDLGTGSGAVALALAGERPEWRLTATDVSPEALAVARGNARRLGLVRVEFLQGDWFGPVGGRRFDLMVSNPPYVAADDPALERAPLCFEPRAALTPGRAAPRTRSRPGGGGR